MVFKFVKFLQCLSMWTGKNFLFFSGLLNWISPYRRNLIQMLPTALNTNSPREKEGLDTFWPKNILMSKWSISPQIRTWLGISYYFLSLSLHHYKCPSKPKKKVLKFRSKNRAKSASLRPTAGIGQREHSGKVRVWLSLKL